MPRSFPFLYVRELEKRRQRCAEFQSPVGDRMDEAEYPSMEAEPVDRVVAWDSVLLITAYGVTHVGSMDADLVLAPGFQSEFHERVIGCAVEHMKVGHSILAAIVGRRGVGIVGLIVLQP